MVTTGAAAGALQGTLWGSLLGLLFLNPLLGAAIGASVGASAGATTGALLDIGINDAFIQATGETLQPGTSALCVLVRQATPDRVIAAVQRYAPTVLHTSLSALDETALRDALAAKQAAPRSSGGRGAPVGGGLQPRVEAGGAAVGRPEAPERCLSYAAPLKPVDRIGAGGGRGAPLLHRNDGVGERVGLLSSQAKERG